MQTLRALTDFTNWIWGLNDNTGNGIVEKCKNNNKHGLGNFTLQNKADDCLRRKFSDVDLNKILDDGWFWVDALESLTSASVEDQVSDLVETCDSSLLSSSLHDEWIITPPSCFTKADLPNCEKSIYCVQNGRPKLCTNNEISIFENLLIEHPSFSVYEKYPERLNHMTKPLFFDGSSRPPLKCVKSRENLYVEKGRNFDEFVLFDKFRENERVSRDILSEITTNKSTGVLAKRCSRRKSGNREGEGFAQDMNKLRITYKKLL